jgi:hypothetical protein
MFFLFAGGVGLPMAVALVFVTFCSGCASTTTMELSDFALRCNVGRPVVWEPVFAKPPTEVYNRLIQVLEESRVQVIARDTENGFVSWMDSAGDFVPVESGSEQPGFKFRQGLVHGSARVRVSGDKTAVYLHCVYRHQFDSSVNYSNGQYERSILKGLEAALTK